MSCMSIHVQDIYTTLTTIHNLVIWVMYMYMYMYTYIYIYIHTHIHVYIHTYIRQPLILGAQQRRTRRDAHGVSCCLHPISLSRFPYSGLLTQPFRGNSLWAWEFNPLNVTFGSDPPSRIPHGRTERNRKRGMGKMGDGYGHKSKHRRNVHSSLRKAHLRLLDFESFDSFEETCNSLSTRWAIPPFPSPLFCLPTPISLVVV